MDFANIEGAQPKSSVNKAAEMSICELSDLQLAFIGGGQGETVAI